MKSKDYHTLKDEYLNRAVERKEIIKQSSQGNFGMYDVLPANIARTVSEACDGFFKSRNIRYGSAWFHDRLDRKKKIQQAKDERDGGDYGKEPLPDED
jgi:hypothetical protein